MSLPKGALVSPITKTIVSYLLEHGPARVTEIDAAIMKIDGLRAYANPANMNRVLNKLRMAGHIHRILRDDEMLWVHGPHPQTVDPAAEAQAEPDPVVLAVVQAPRFDVFRASAYVPDAGPALRPGAMDFMRVPTFGTRC